MTSPHVLITGATGLIGGAVLAQAAQAWPEARFTALVRARDDSEARFRLLTRLRRLTDLQTATEIAARTEILCGDLKSLSRIPDGRFRDMTHVLHLAAETSFFAKESSWRMNFEGTMAVAEAATAMPRLERFLHVSTATVCGSNAPRMIHEDAYPDAAAIHIAPYTYTKACAETALRERYFDLPVVIARPSIVVGHSRLGAAPSSSILWFVRAADAMHLVSSDPEGGIDFIPSDWTADALLLLLTKPKLAHDLYHVSAGTGARTYWPALRQAFANWRGEPLQPLTHLPAGDRQLLSTRFKATFGGGDARLTLMHRGCRKYFEFCALDATFDNSRLLAEGMAPPPSLPEYLVPCLENPGGLGILDAFLDDMDMFETPAPVAA
ncbi:SDR family oxidoreductase [Roseococcus pinisoli]|uniref:SDR family oxidoreductase n=1 Tax=Roseococcus pinisoli TaxID=2835040 RepID=A0ABS5Q7A6_9PROT|nr:SDR family oxidoreductase [Roseococcus pinisoli]MBS7809491.1 SDR family oxidoreductase [Roseococcus pinisoli]